MTEPPARKFRWSIAPSQPVLTQPLAAKLGISELLAQCLLNRGLSDPETITRFLEPRLKNLADPFLLPNMDKAVERLFQARPAGECVVIFGDYDVDGVTATALLTEALRRLGWKTEYYLPHRLDEGYGLTALGVENCFQKFKPTLLLAVDCGSTSVETVSQLKRLGVDVIVLDHHQVCDPGPDAVALVNPQLSSPRAGRGADFRELCSVGLAFKLIHALAKRGRDLGLPEFFEFDLRPLLDLAALGTIADVVPLIGENRILVTRGLDCLNLSQRPGLVALREIARTGSRIGGYEVSFQLAPRLNAAGRLENALDALRLLLAADLQEARALATRLDAHNTERQGIEQKMVDSLMARLRPQFDPGRDFVVVEGDPAWHIGIVGIAASRVCQEFYRPAIIFGGDGDQLRGSGRSIEGFDLAAALRECADLLLKHGGHAMAAGVSIKPENIEALRARLNGIAGNRLQPEQLRPTLRVDASVSCRDLTMERVRELERLQQTGLGNPNVHLCLPAVTHAQPVFRFGAGRQHARIRVTDGTGVLNGVLWNDADGPLPVGQFDLACTPQIHHYQGEANVRLKILDWRPVP